MLCKHAGNTKQVDVTKLWNDRRSIYQVEHWMSFATGGNNTNI